MYVSHIQVNLLYISALYFSRTMKPIFVLYRGGAFHVQHLDKLSLITGVVLYTFFVNYPALLFARC